MDLKKIKFIVDTNDKKRFEMKTESNGEVFIRASQGHSIKSLDETKIMTEIVDAKLISNVIVHGTSEQSFERIKTEGLKIMNRNHIHFAIGYPEDKEKVISGMRGNCQIFIELDIERAINDGMKFFLSTNKVVLSSGFDGGVIEPKYFKAVKNRLRQNIQ